jgi:hypothetical protein
MYVNAKRRKFSWLLLFIFPPPPRVHFVVPDYLVRNNVGGLQQSQAVTYDKQGILIISMFIAQ